MNKKIFASLALSTSVATLCMFAPVVHAQSNDYDYKFCTEDIDTPPQELVDAIAKVLNYNYQGGVESVAPVCYGLNPRAKNQETWVYTADFKDGSALDIAVIEGRNGRSISIQDRSSSRDESGWTKWIPLR